MKKHVNKYKINLETFEPKFIADAEFDFHNRGVLLPYDIEKLLSEFIEDSYYNSLRRVLVIVGKGGVVRPKVDSLLKRNKLVDNYKFAGYFNGQDGAFEVWLKE
jgi:DNA-nicking Smr family endonuclease